MDQIRATQPRTLYPGSFHGDGAALEVHYFNPVPKGGTKTAIMTYKPM